MSWPWVKELYIVDLTGSRARNSALDSGSRATDSALDSNLDLNSPKSLELDTLLFNLGSREY